MTVGPYLPITLKSYSATIDSIYPRTFISASSLPHPTGKPTATFKLQLSMLGQKEDVASISVSLQGGEGFKTTLKDTQISVKDIQDIFNPKTSTFNVVEWGFSEGEIDLWWPVGYGQPTLYSVLVSLKDTVSLFLHGEITVYGSSY